MHIEPFKHYYQRQLEKGQRPELARLSLARKLAAITLTVWKSRSEFDPAQAINLVAE